MKQTTKQKSAILLPGGAKQLKQLKENAEYNFDKILVAGESSEQLAKMLAEDNDCVVDLIVEDYNALLEAKLTLDGFEKVIPKIMEFERTDFQGDTFDLIFAQASFSRENRKNIIKEMKRILKPGGVLSVGEIALKTKSPPQMINDLLMWAGIEPLAVNEIEKYYAERGFEILKSEVFENELKNYYEKIHKIFEQRKDDLSENEKSFYKKLINRIRHEANVFLKFGGEKFLTFYSFVAKKS